MWKEIRSGASRSHPYVLTRGGGHSIRDHGTYEREGVFALWDETMKNFHFGYSTSWFYMLNMGLNSRSKKYEPCM